MSLVLQFELILKIGSIKCAYGGRQKNISRAGLAYRILMGKPEGRRPLERRRRTWVDNIKVDLRESGWGGKDWIDLVQDRDQWRALLNTVMRLRVP
jgi:hypothetical protein